MRYNLSKQEEVAWCVPACLQAILRRYDIYEEQRDIASALGTDGNGTQVDRIGEFLFERGFDFEDFNYNQVPFNEPGILLGEAHMRGQDVLVDIALRNGLKHFLLLEELTSKNIAMLDPDTASRVVRNLERLHREMYQRKIGGFGVIQKI